MKQNGDPGAAADGQGRGRAPQARQEKEGGRRSGQGRRGQAQGRKHAGSRLRGREPLAQPQRFFTSMSLLAVCACITMVLWIAYDAVIPALPSISADFGSSSSVTNLVLFPFLLAMALGQLVSGTLSDRVGRKPVLLVGGTLFFVFSGLCALAPNIWLLILFRIPEGLGCGTMMTMLITVVTDSYRGKAFDRAMTIMQALPIIGPVAAPFLGSLMMTLFTWHAIFALLAVLGAASLVAVLLFDATLPASERLTTGMAANLRSMAPVCREPGFLGTTLVLALIGMPMMAFLAVSSYIYLEQFAIGYVGYSAFYAFTAGVGVLSPFVYLRLSGRVGENAIAKACLVVMGASGVMTGLFGYSSAWGVLVASVPLFFVEAIFRAQGFVALLEDRTESRGAANSVATFLYSAVSALGTVAASFPWGNFVTGVMVITLGCTVVASGVWLCLAKRGHLLKRYRKG